MLFILYIYIYLVIIKQFEFYCENLSVFLKIINYSFRKIKETSYFHIILRCLIKFKINNFYKKYLFDLINN